jgi:hypothetical protein
MCFVLWERMMKACEKPSASKQFKPEDVIAIVGGR